MKKFQKAKENQKNDYRSPDWFKGKNSFQKSIVNIKPVSFHGTQHRG